MQKMILPRNNIKIGLATPRFAGSLDPSYYISRTRLLFQRSGQIKIYAPHHKAWQVLFGKNVNPYRESPFVLGRKTADTESN